MTAPVIRQFVGSIPDKGQAQTTFDTNVDAWLDWTTLQFAPDLVAFGTWADGIRAALIAGNLPPLTGRALDAVRVNAAANGVEFADVTAAGWALLDDVDGAAQRVTLGLVIGTNVSAPIAALTQVQAENPASTVFGTVSGQRLAQAIAVNPPNYGTGNAELAVGAIGTYAFLGRTTSGSEIQGDTLAGSSLRYVAVRGGTDWSNFTPSSFDARGSSETPAGTWRAMGLAGSGGTSFAATLYLRIA